MRNPLGPASAIRAPIEGSINTLLIERSRDAGKPGTTRAVGPSHNGSCSLWRRGSRTMAPNIAFGELLALPSSLPLSLSLSLASPFPSPRQNTRHYFDKKATMMMTTRKKSPTTK